MTGVSGFTIVRNAVLLDYPFEASITSMEPLCDEIVIACGDSDDGTRELCRKLEARWPGKIRLLETVWERAAQTGGYQLKAQTDLALAACRNPWALYLQADEVIHEADHPRILHALDRARPRAEIDGIVFDYLHFYGNYSHVIRGRHWYRREVRLLRTGSGLEAFRDAQGFRRGGRRVLGMPSGARVFHYGHVRSVESMRRKSEEMGRWWGESPVTAEARLRPRRHVGVQVFQGTHPEPMAARVARNAEYDDPLKRPRVWTASEAKDWASLIWERFFPRIGEFRNYELG